MEEIDPKANIAEQIILATNLLGEDYYSEDDAIALAELVMALHDWRMMGGFDPYSSGEVALDYID